MAASDLLPVIRVARGTVTPYVLTVGDPERAASIAAPSSDMLSLAVLVALNIADEYFRARQQTSTASGDLNERAMRLERLVDDVLAQVTLKKAVAAP